MGSSIKPLLQIRMILVWRRIYLAIRNICCCIAIFCSRLEIGLLRFRIAELIRLLEAVLLKGSNTRFQFLPCFPIRLSHESVQCSLLRHDDLGRYSPTGTEPVMGVGDDDTMVNRPCSFTMG